MIEDSEELCFQQKIMKKKKVRTKKVFLNVEFMENAFFTRNG